MKQCPSSDGSVLTTINVMSMSPSDAEMQLTVKGAVENRHHVFKNFRWSCRVLVVPSPCNSFLHNWTLRDKTWSSNPHRIRVR